MNVQIPQRVADQIGYFFTGKVFKCVSGDDERLYEVKEIVRTKVGDAWVLYFIYGNDDTGNFSKEMNLFLTEFGEVIHKPAVVMRFSNDRDN